MGELRAYVLPVEELRAVLDGGPAQRDRVRELVGPVLAPGWRPSPLGPIFTHVPGSAVVRDDEPGPADLDRLLGGGPVPPERLRATWRLVEAVVAGLAAASTRTRSGRPHELRPLGLALAEPDGATTGTWTPARARELPGLQGLVEQAGQGDLLVFWSAGEGGGPTG